MNSQFSLVRGMDPAAGAPTLADPVALIRPPVLQATELITSKLAVPRSMGAWIERAKLIGWLDNASGRKLVVVAAPGGYGKSTLLAQWHAQRHAAAAIAWLSLDAQDGDPGRFFRYLIAAIGTVLAGFETPLTDSWPPHVSTIIANLGLLAQPLWIVLDDFHQLGNYRLIQDISSLIRRSPATVHWIVAGRCTPELDLSQHKLQDDVALMDAATLSFGGEEIIQLAARLCDVSLGSQEAEAMHAATEGWAAGIKLTLLASHDAGHASLQLASGAGGDVAHYLASAILHAQSPAMREVLMATSIVDRINGELCNALLGIGNGAAVVAGLEQSQLFIQADDVERGWYRYHRLFLEFLRSSLRDHHPERMAQLHHKASQWYAGQQMGEAALKHAFASGDRSWGIELTARCARQWLKAGEIGRILHWVGRLTREESLHHELIGPIYITCLIWRRRLKEASAALHETRTALLALGEETPATRARLRTLQLMLDLLSGGSDHLDLTEELPADGRTDTYLTGTLMTLQAYWLLGRCRFDLARRLALRAREIMQHHDSLYALGYANGVIAQADLAQGDLASAGVSVEEMFAGVKDTRGPAWSNAAGALARMRYEQNRLAETAALCTELLPLLSSASTVENYAVAHILLARVKAAQGLFADSFKLLDYLHSMLESDGLHGFLAHVCYEKIRLHLHCGDRDRAVAVAAHFALPQRMARGEWLEPRDYSTRWDQFGLAQAALLLDAQEYDGCRKLLNTLLASAYTVGFIGRAILLEAVLSVCEWRGGERASAFAALNRGLLLTRKVGFTRCAFDEAPGLAEIIMAATEARRLQHPLPAGFLEKFQDFFADVVTVAGPRRVPHEPLTTREIEILVLLAQGLNNQQISSRSQIALSTTKWHLKNLFAKLGVNTRTGALARARDLRLIG